MKKVSKLLFALCISLFIFLPLTEANEGNNPEINQIVAAAKRYSRDNLNLPKNKQPAIIRYVFVKKRGDCALVNSVPMPNSPYKGEITGILLKRIGGKWVGQFIGTDPVVMKEICPNLFK